MGVNINMSGVNINGNSKVLNNAKISGDENNVDIRINQSSFLGEANILNNLDVENGEITVNMDNVHSGKDVNFMNNRTVRSNATKTSTNTHLTRVEEKPQKVGILKKLLDKLMRKTGTIPTKTHISSSKDKHTKFANVLSGNSEYKNIDVGVADKLKKQENNKEFNKEEHIQKEI